MDWTGKKTLVTGGAGFIGSNIARRLVELGANVTVMDSLAYGLKKQIPGGVTFVQGDTRDEAVYAKLRPVEYVFHFGAPSSIVLFNKDLDDCVENTIGGLMKVLAWSQKQGVKHLVFPSSGSVYGTAQPPQGEATMPEPVNTYGKTKLACEWIAKAYTDLSWTALRISAGFGPGEAFKKEFASVITIFADAIEQGEGPVIFGDGTQVRDFVYIDDVVDAMLSAAEQRHAGVLNVASGESRSFNDVVASINRILGSSVQASYVPKPANYLERTEMSTDLVKQVLGRNPLTLDEGIERYLAHRQGK